MTKDPVSMWYFLLELAGLDLHTGADPKVVFDRLQTRGHTEWKLHHVRDIYNEATRAARKEYEAGQWPSP
jgi:hypothetical protein